MKHKFLLLYAWLIHSFFFFMPDYPLLMRFRGFLYGLGMNRCGRNFQVAHSAIINSLEGLSVGDNVYVANYSVILSKGVEIGNNVLIGPSCVLSSSNHILHNGSFRYKTEEGLGIKIGDGSWVASNCTLLSGAELPPSSVLAANSVLTSKIELRKSHSIYGGTPARLIKIIED